MEQRLPIKGINQILEVILREPGKKIRASHFHQRIRRPLQLVVQYYRSLLEEIRNRYPSNIPVDKRTDITKYEHNISSLTVLFGVKETRTRADDE